MKALLPFILLLCLCGFPFTSKGDSPPCWCEFETVSENGKYIAYVNKFPEDSLKERHHARWRMRVYEQSTTPKLIWSTQYAYDGYRGGWLSNDGQYFVSISSWYYPEYSLFTIYKNGVEINTDTLIGKAFKIPKRKLIKTVSHYVWLDYEYEYQFKKDTAGAMILTIRTSNKKIRQINLDKGVLVKPTK